VNGSPGLSAVIRHMRSRGRLNRASCGAARIQPDARRLLPGVALALLLCLAAGRAAPGASPQTPPQTPPAAPSARVVQLRIDGEIEPVMAEYVDGAIGEANREGAALILITLDTPGGLDTSMRDIIQHIMESSAPVVVYVTPAGSRAASAGFFILLSADVAAMAPGTHTGAASPIVAIGGYPVTVDETLKNKILNDATAYMRSYAGRRGRNVALAETAVTDAKAFTETEALNGKLIDLVANSPDELLAALNGRTIARLDGRTMPLVLPRPEIVNVGMSARQRFLAFIVQPDVFFILLLGGVLGLYVEFTHPGLVAPGVIGAVALLLALFAMQILPINVAGLLLIVLALALFILEAKYTSYGVLGVGGAVAMLLGALMLVRSPLTGAGVSLGVALGATLPLAVITIVLMRLVLRSHAWTPQTGVEALIGEVGDVTEAIGDASGARAPYGMVRLRGEQWRAASTSPIPRGVRVRVVRVDGLTLYVEPGPATSRP
jgi:membrane-bound serine protease (ClpP class)